MSSTTQNTKLTNARNEQPPSMRGSPLCAFDDDDDLDTKIAELQRRKAERCWREEEEEERKLLEMERRKVELRAAMTKAAVEKMVAEQEAEAEAKRWAEEVARVQGGGEEAGEFRGQKRPRSDLCTRCRERGVECEWPESGRGKSCLACVAKKAKLPNGGGLEAKEETGADSGVRRRIQRGRGKTRPDGGET